jgi:TRAP-type C4-dicarboxylate transport system permease small subunit
MKVPVWLKKTATFLFDVMELYIPLLSFSVMFVVFIVSIFFRYFLNNPLTWPYEITIFGFIWTAVLGATYTRRHHAHVKFTLTYDRASPRGKALIRIAGNGMIALFFAISLYPTYDYIQFKAFQRSTVLGIPFNIAFGPYLFFLVLIIGHCIYDIVIDAKKLSKGEFDT